MESKREENASSHQKETLEKGEIIAKQEGKGAMGRI